MSMAEQMEAKIKAYCRVRPLTPHERDGGYDSIVKLEDENIVCVASQPEAKRFKYDRVFMEDTSQEQIFDETKNLIQSAVDGDKVSIFSYGQTRSGKTFTVFGDRGENPGIAPRAFELIFKLIEENKSKKDVLVNVSMLEFYMGEFVDLFREKNSDVKIKVKKGEDGTVFAEGAVVLQVQNAENISELFEAARESMISRMTGMNISSAPRSHVILTITLASTDKATGDLKTGKISFVDLAGDDRSSNRNVTGQEAKESMAINKSLVSLYTVMCAVSHQKFVPYRDSRLTWLLNDSIGGTAKTLLFVNVSTAEYNMDQTILCLRYGVRVRQASGEKEPVNPRPKSDSSV